MRFDSFYFKLRNRFELNDRLVYLFSWTAIAVSFAVMLGWILDIIVVTKLHPNLASMKFNTALCFLLSGIALLTARERYERFSTVSRVTSYLVTAISALSLLEYWYPSIPNIDELFVLDLDTDPSVAAPGRMSAATAQCFLTLGLAYALLDVRGFLRIRCSEILSLATLYGGLIGTLGYLFDTSALYSFFPYASMAIHTSILMILLGAGGLLVRPKRGAMSVIMSKFIGGTIARRILPIALVVPIFLGWLRVLGEDLGYFLPEVGLAVFIVLISLVVLAVVLVSARHLNNLEGELREKSEALQRVVNIVESSRNGIFSKSLEGTITSWNAGAELIFGYKAREMVGQKSTKLLEESHLDKIHAALELILVGKKPTPFETQITRKDGRIVDVSVSVSAVFDSESKLIGSSIIATDISEKLQLDRDLRNTLEDLKAFKHALDEHAIVAITDASGKIKYVNQRFCEISKYSKEELIGQDHRLVNSGYHPKSFIKELWATILSGNVWRGEICNRAKDGSSYWVETTIVPFLDENGKPVEFLAIRADITSTKEAQQDLIRSNKDLEHFAYVASHDLQEPLRAVSGCLSLLEKRYSDQLDTRASELIEHSVDGSERMQALIEGLLEFSRVNTQSQALKEVDLNISVRKALRNLTASIEESGANVEVAQLPKIQGVPNQIELLFQNLLSNAIKFRSEKAPHIEIGVTQDKAGYSVYVKDNGIGIEEKYFERIYVIFKRLHTRREYPGTGIGLAICKRIVERHGGQMRVESVYGEGSTFYCLFPAPQT